MQSPGPPLAGCRRPMARAEAVGIDTVRIQVSWARGAPNRLFARRSGGGGATDARC